MIKNWLQKPDLSGLQFEELPAFTLGKHLMGAQLRQRELRKVSVAVVGLDDTMAKKTRESLYNLAWNFGGLRIADLGDVRNSNPEFVIPLLRELQSSGIVPLLIGANMNGFRAQYQAFQELQRQVSLLVVDQEVRLTVEASRHKAAVLNSAVHAKRKKLFHLSHLGSQRHLVDPAIYQLLDQRYFDYVRLGEARDNLQELEPVIRDADLFALDLSAVKKVEAPAQFGHQPSGFDLLGLTQLCRYAGMSDKLTSFGVYGMDTTADEQAQTITAAATAQLIWYFIDGFANRKGDFPASAKGLLEYIVDLKDFDRITFWKSPRSGRWWIQAPAGKKNGEERHRLVPCSYQDYLRAVEQEIPERLIQAFRRFD